MQIKDKIELAPMIRQVCKQLLCHADDATEVSLLLGTAAVESRFVYRKQIGGGPARGLWQMEPFTAQDIFRSYLRYNPDRYIKLMRISGYVMPDTMEQEIKVPSIRKLYSNLAYNDSFACAMARIHYLRVKEAIPDTLEGQAVYWKKYYNTPLGAGTVEKYLQAWETCGCAELLEV